MTGTIYDIKKFAVHDGPGIRTTVFFKGCPLDCWWCQNPESMNSYSDAIGGWETSVPDLMNEIEKDIVFYEESGGGFTASGGEPLVQAVFLSTLLKTCRNRGIHTTVDTSGYAEWQEFSLVLPFTDLFLYDLKLVDSSVHQQYTGKDNRLILENLEKLDKSGAEIIIRIPLIPGITDTAENLKGAADIISGLVHVQKIDLLPYNVLSRDKYRRFCMKNRLEKLETQPEDVLEGCVRLFESLKREVTIGG